MSDHIRKKGNKDIFLAVFAATVTTIGAMAAIFLMEKSQRENLVDFFLIFSINLAMSLLTALFLIPALSEIDRKSTRLNSSHVAISYAVRGLQKTNARQA